MTVLTADELMVDADTPEIPVGIDGETVLMPHPVRVVVTWFVAGFRIPGRTEVRPAQVPSTMKRMVAEPIDGQRDLPPHACDLVPEHQGLRLLNGITPRQADAQKRRA